MPVLNVTWNLADEPFRVEERWVNFRDGTYERVDFRAQQFDPFNATASTFMDCDFRKAKFRSGVLGHIRSVPRAVSERVWALLGA